MDTFIYDMHSGRLDDLEFGIKALTKAPLESEKIVIVITSVLSWGMTPPKMVEDIPEPILDENGNPIEPQNPDQSNPQQNEENKDGEKIEKSEEEKENEDKKNDEDAEVDKTKNSAIEANRSNINEDENNRSLEKKSEINEEELKRQQELDMLEKMPKKKVFL